jgi:hypothetical protein
VLGFEGGGNDNGNAGQGGGTSTPTLQGKVEDKNAMAAVRENMEEGVATLRMDITPLPSIRSSRVMTKRLN